MAAVPYWAVLLIYIDDSLYWGSMNGLSVILSHYDTNVSFSFNYFQNKNMMKLKFKKIEKSGQ